MMVGNKRMPGGGTMINAIATSVDTKPIITGKPNPVIINLLCEKY